MAGTFSSRWQGHFQVDAFSAAGVWLLCTELEGWTSVGSSSGHVCRQVTPYSEGVGACEQTGHSIFWVGERGGGRKWRFLIQVIKYCVQRKTFIR